MAKKKKMFPDPKDVRGLLFTAPLPLETKILYGMGAAVLGFALMKCRPKLANELIPVLISAFTPPEGFGKQCHLEGAEPVTTQIDERQLGRSEVISEIAHPKRN